ncbi:hypothetical protein AtNW77_Chr3g0194781 [Arabidopsis thaliana]
MVAQSWTLNRGWPCDFGLDGPGEIRDAWLGQSGAGDALPVLTEEEFRDLNGLFVPENAELRPGPSQPRHGRGKVFEVGARENARSESRSLVMGLSASRETSQFCGRRANKNQAPKGVEALIPEPHQRPSDCPEGYICLFESYFTEGGLWFPLPEFLTSYCSRRNIPFSQLSVASIRNAVGLVILAAEERLIFLKRSLVFRLELRTQAWFVRIRDEVLRFSTVATSRVRDWRKCFFFAKLSDVSVEDTNLSCGSFHVLKRLPTISFLSNLSLLCKRSALSWPHMLEHFIDCEASTLGSPSCLRMGSCELPCYADQFDDDEELVCEDEPQVPIDEPIHEGSAEAIDTVDVCVVKPEVPNKDRATEVAAARAGKKVLKETTGSVPFIERLRNYIIGLRAYSVPKYTLCQVKGVQECLETMIAKGTAIPEARMKILAKGRPIWQSKGRCDRGSRDSRKRPRPLPGAAERWGRRHRCVI